MMQIPKKIRQSLELDLRGREKPIYQSSLNMGSVNPQGDVISFSNYYMEWNAQPFFGVIGEFHFSRYPHEGWEEALLKMKVAGVNLVATYVFWIHHEEEQGCFIWDGNYNLKKFIELCAKLELKLILRVGPFCHGECRNGGIPDWLYGRPFDLRSNDRRYLAYVEKLYAEIGLQSKGYLFKDGGPVVGIQLENEYMHAGAPWEMTNGQSNELITAGHDGVSHMAELKRLAIAAGLDVPFYTSTGWGGAPVLEDEVLPLYGGYAYTPWNVKGNQREQPPTTEYLFQNYHSNSHQAHGFEPPYPPENYPYACCEMGGGMQAWYQARFQVEPASVEAMTLQKIAGGCNLIGYYVFHGGTQPVGKHAYMNEQTCPKITYDYQAPIGEFGQVRESYMRLKQIFTFLRSFGQSLCGMATALPEGAERMTPEDTEHVRFAARSSGGSGYLFLNNYQDHVVMKDQKGLEFKLKLDQETLSIPAEGGLDLCQGVSTFLPFNMSLGSVILKYATAQPITVIQSGEEQVYFFCAPEGMAAEFCFREAEVGELKMLGGIQRRSNGLWIAAFRAGEPGILGITAADGHQISIRLLTPKQALSLWDVEVWGRRRIIFSDTPLTVGENGLSFYQRGGGSLEFSIFPATDIPSLTAGGRRLVVEESGGVATCSIELPVTPMTPIIEYRDKQRATVSVPESLWTTDHLHEIFLSIEYEGDIGNAFIDGELVSDHFWNGDLWEIGLSRFAACLENNGLDLYIAPERCGEVTTTDSAMAIQYIFEGEEKGIIHALRLIPEYKITL